MFFRNFTTNTILPVLPQTLYNLFLRRLFFRELPNPLLTYELYDKFMVSMKFPQFYAVISAVICGFDKSLLNIICYAMFQILFSVSRLFVRLYC